MAVATCPLCSGDQMLPLPSVGGRDYSRCVGCALASMAPAQRPSLERERAEYRLHQNDPEDPRYREFLGRVTEPLLPLLRAGSEGLDYGCGPGPALSAMLRERGFDVRDYDPLFAADDAALARTYDFVTCTETAEHFHRPAEEFRRLDGLLRPGGWLAVMTEMMDEARGRFGTWWYVRDRTHVCFYARRTMRWIARRHRWEVLFPSKNVTLFAKRSPPAGAPPP